MWQTTTCDKCNSVLKYDNRSVVEGNREHQDVLCPLCKNVVGRVFTDLIPSVYVIQDNYSHKVDK